MTKRDGKLSQGAVTAAGKDGPSSTCTALAASLGAVIRPTNSNTPLPRNDLFILPSRGARVNGRFIDFDVGRGVLQCWHNMSLQLHQRCLLDEKNELSETYICDSLLGQTLELDPLFLTSAIFAVICCLPAISSSSSHNIITTSLLLTEGQAVVGQVRVATITIIITTSPLLLGGGGGEGLRLRPLPSLNPFPSLPEHRGTLVEVVCSHNVFRCFAHRTINE